METADEERTALPAMVVRFARTCLVAGIVSMAVLSWWWPPAWPDERAGAQTVWLVPLVVLLAIVTSCIQVEYISRHLEGAEAPEEVALVVGLCTVGPSWSAGALVAGAVAAAVLSRQAPIRAAFNLGWTAAAAAAAAGIHAALDPADPFSPYGVLAATIAVVVYAVVNWAAMTGLRRGFEPARPWSHLFRAGLRGHLATALLAGATGLVGAALLVRAPMLVPLLVLPMLLHRSRLQQQQALHRTRTLDHQRLERTVAGATDGIALVDGYGRIEVWNPVMEALTGTPVAHAAGRRVDDVLADARTDSEVDLPAGTILLRGAGGVVRVVQLERSEVERAEDRGHGVVLLARDVTAQAELDRMREDLVSRVSHELRTPLASVSGLLETVLLRWDGLTEERRLTLLDRAHRASNRLTRLVSALLTHARIERVSTPVFREPVDLATTIEELLAELGAVLDHAVDRELAPGVVASADPGHVAQIVTGLLVNASTYGRPPLQVTTHVDATAAVVAVRDHGDGVPPEFVPDLFTPFAQASTGLQRTAHGLGLGLSISRRLAEANGGSLDYVPVPDGPGARFELRLPLAGPDTLGLASIGS